MIEFNTAAHIAAALRTHEECAIADHVAFDSARMPLAAEAMAARANRWRQLAEANDLLDNDPEFALVFGKALAARIAARAAADGDPLADWERELLATPDTKVTVTRVALVPAAAAGEKCPHCIYQVIRADGLCPRCDERAAVIADVRQLMDLLEATPELPIDRHLANGLSFHAHGAEDEQHSIVDAAAAVLGTPVKDETQRHGHYSTTLTIGFAEYGVVAISERAMDRYHKVNELGEAAVSAIEKAPLDEDQPTSQPATPARGHGQDETDDDANPFEIAAQTRAAFGLADEPEYMHAMKPDDIDLPRCGADGHVVSFTAAVDCPDCLLLPDEPDDDAGHGDTWIDTTPGETL